MSAPKGNQFWKARSTHGRKPLFGDPDVLMDACEQYFQWVQDNPLLEERVFVHQGNVTRADVEHMRAMTIGGLCTFLGMDVTTWREYKDRKGFTPIVREVEQIIREQKFTGAAADLLNANIISRDLGLADKSELTGKDGGPLQTEDVTQRDADDFTRSILGLVAIGAAGAGTDQADPGGEGES